jgi:DNA-binding phage protein
MQDEILNKIVCAPAFTDKAETLTPAGEQLLSILVEPTCRELTITQICQKAGISRDSYYRLFKDPRFIAAYLDACKVTAIAAAMPTMQSVAARAIAGDIQAAQTILQMSGLHVPTATVNVHQTIDAGPSLRELLDSRKADN